MAKNYGVKRGMVKCDMPRLQHKRIAYTGWPYSRVLLPVTRTPARQNDEHQLPTSTQE